MGELSLDLSIEEIKEIFAGTDEKAILIKVLTNSWEEHLHLL